MPKNMLVMMMRQMLAPFLADADVDTLTAYRDAVVEFIDGEIAARYGVVEGSAVEVDELPPAA